MTNKFNELLRAQMLEAQEWVKKSSLDPEFSLMVSNLRKDFDYSHLYAHAGENDIKLLFKKAHEVAIDSVYSRNSSVAEISSKAYNRLLAILGMSEAPKQNGWISPSLMDSFIEDYKDDFRFNDSEFAYEGIEKYFMPYVFAFSTSHERVRSFSDEAHRTLLPKDADVRPTPELQMLNEEGRDDELIGYLKAVTKGLSGRVDKKSYMRREISREEANERLVAKALSFLKDTYVSHHDIAISKNMGIAPEVHLWDTQAFQQNMAPRVTEEGIASGKSLLKSWLQSDLREELKGQLSKREIFNSFMLSSHNELKTWQDAMNAYAAFTGETLSFNEARALQPERYFKLSSTKAYMQKLDREFKSNRIADKYLILNFELEKTPDGAYCYSVESPCIHHADINEEVTNLLFEIESEGTTVSDCGDMVHADIFLADGRKARKILKDFSEKVKDTIAEKIQNVPCPGDRVSICQSEDEETEEDLGIKFGTSGVVTYVNELDRYLKVFGVDQYISFDNVLIDRKYEPNLSRDESLAL
ncbi:hypothetical protein [Vibrio harveyi]|uniref:hypothetical protein n=1 Tax=Vibrio harveyi TaxID=669 RepID=UPI003CF43535